MSRAPNSWILQGLPFFTSLVVAVAALGCSGEGASDPSAPAAAGAADIPAGQPESDDGDATREGGGTGRASTGGIGGRETSGTGAAGGSDGSGGSAVDPDPAPGSGGAGGSGDAEPTPEPDSDGQGGGTATPSEGGSIDCAWLTECDGACVDVASDPNSCGGCGITCDPTQGCLDGDCVPCPPAWSWCVETCVNPMADTSNCGGCGIVCGENEACVDGSCS